MSLMFGADPELFLQKLDKKKEKWEFVSAEDKNGPIIPGTKKNPYPVRKGAIQVDGVAAEFNIDPTNNLKGFLDNTSSVIKELRTQIKAKSPETKLIPVPTATFSQRYFDELPTHTKALGCDPDFNAYLDGKANPRPQTDKPFRTGSGHIHIGWYNAGNFVDPGYIGHIKDCCLVVKQLDKYLLFAAQDWDKDKKRQKLYGAPGSFRPKPFGVEYRPLSNAWLQSAETVQTVFLITLGVMRGIESGKFNLDAPKLVSNPNMTNSKLVLRRLSQYLPECFK